jgi:hypothetical protein
VSYYYAQAQHGNAIALYLGDTQFTSWLCFQLSWQDFCDFLSLTRWILRHYLEKWSWLPPSKSSPTQNSQSTFHSIDMKISATEKALLKNLKLTHSIGKIITLPILSTLWMKESLCSYNLLPFNNNSNILHSWRVFFWGGGWGWKEGDDHIRSHSLNVFFLTFSITMYAMSYFKQEQMRVNLKCRKFIHELNSVKHPYLNRR